MILGDMLELGTVSADEHQKIVDRAEELKLNVLFVGNEFQKVNRKYNFEFVKNTDEANKYLENRLFNYDSFLLKGSRGIRLENISLFIQKELA